MILYTKRKWLYTSILNIIASFISLAVHLTPANSELFQHFSMQILLSCFIILVSPLERLTWLMVTSMASKITISSLLAILMTCTTEIVSPEKRRLCGYATTVWTRIWLLSAPFVGATSIFGQLGESLTQALVQNNLTFFDVQFLKQLCRFSTSWRL